MIVYFFLNSYKNAYYLTIKVLYAPMNNIGGILYYALGALIPPTPLFF